VANILSQAEVDALLGSVEGVNEEPAGGAAAERRPRSARGGIVPYDYRPPNRKFFKEQLRFFHTIHESFGRLYASELSGYLRSRVEIDLLSAQQLTYGEYIGSLPRYTSLFVFDMPPLDGQGVLEINPSLVLTMIERLFGGFGAQVDVSRDLTDIETAVMTKLVQRGLAVLRKSWENVVDMKPALREHSNNPEMLQLLPNTESVVQVSFFLRMLDASGALSFCYPYVSMEPVVPKISRTKQLLRDKGRALEHMPEVVRTRLSGSRLEVTVELGTTELTVEEFLKLKKGDVLCLERHVDEPIDVKIGGQYKATARPGLKGNHRVVQIEKTVLDRGEDDES
jgi:flagellar motor switch protein FliM